MDEQLNTAGGEVESGQPEGDRSGEEQRRGRRRSPTSATPSPTANRDAEQEHGMEELLRNDETAEVSPLK